MYQGGTGTTPSGRVVPVITMVSGLNDPIFFPPETGVDYGFPWTTGTVLARATGTFLANPMATTLSARGHDSVTSMGRRNLSLVAGGLTHAAPLSTNQPGIVQLYLPGPSGGASMGAGALALLGLAAARRRGTSWRRAGTRPTASGPAGRA